MTTVVYNPDNPAETAKMADRALEGQGCFVMLHSDEVWICPRNRQPVAFGDQLGYGQQLVVENRTWRIEQVKP
jgi:hypothetical protein